MAHIANPVKAAGGQERPGHCPEQEIQVLAAIRARMSHLALQAPGSGGSVRMDRMPPPGCQPLLRKLPAHGSSTTVRRKKRGMERSPFVANGGMLEVRHSQVSILPGHADP